MITPHSVLRASAPLLVGSLLCSCASVSVKEADIGGVGSPSTKPSHIYVVPYSVDRTKAKESFARKEKNTLKFESQQMLTQELVTDLTETVAPASVLNPGAKPKKNSWIVSGNITRVAEGSRFLRMGIGLGMGGTKLETKTEVKSEGAPPFLEFETTGGSGAFPGGATNPIPFSGLPTALLHVNEGTTDDADRTARQIAARIAQYMVRRGWLDPGKAPPVKKLGQ